MKEVFHKVEHVVDKLVPYAVLLLLVVLIVTFFFKGVAARHEVLMELGDVIVVCVFVADLVFKFVRVRRIKQFVRLYWLDILAVFPFYLFFRVLEETFLLFRASETMKEGQSLLHVGTRFEEVVKLEKEGGKIIAEAENVQKLSRTRFVVRFLRPLSRIPRLAKVIPYFEKTTGRHHPHDPR